MKIAAGKVVHGTVAVERVILEEGSSVAGTASSPVKVRVATRKGIP